MGLSSLAHACEAVAATTLKTEKVSLVAEYLRALPLEEAGGAALYLTGQAFPRREERILAVGGSMLWETVQRISGASAEAMEEAYRRHGDLGNAVMDLLPTNQGAQGITLADVKRYFNNLAKCRARAQKQPLLEDMLRRAKPLEAKYIIKIITGDLRIGLKESLVEEAIAKAFGSTLAEVQRANMLTGDISHVLRLAAEGRLPDAALQLLNPIGFMLASPAETAQDIAEAFPEGVLIEDKYDGIRAQVHKQGERVKIFSRTLDEVVEFHELNATLKALPGEFVLDGEIVGWRDGRPLPFTELQKRLGRKEPDLWLPMEIPVAFRVFDLLYLDGELCLDLPLRERRRRLDGLLKSAPPSIQVSAATNCNSAEEIQRAFDAALERGNEGLMAKAPDSLYTPGRRGRSWLKLKRPMGTLDVVVTAAEYGHGKRHDVLSDYTFAVRDGERLLNVGKAYSGLTDAEIQNLTRYFKEHTVKDEGFRRQVEPTVVLEVAFNNMQRSNRHASGYALRFPRIVRVRQDKPASEIDTLDRVRELYETQFKR